MIFLFGWVSSVSSVTAACIFTLQIPITALALTLTRTSSTSLESTQWRRNLSGIQYDWNIRRKPWRPAMRRMYHRKPASTVINRSGPYWALPFRVPTFWWAAEGHATCEEGKLGTYTSSCRRSTVGCVLNRCWIRRDIVAIGSVADLPYFSTFSKYSVSLTETRRTSRAYKVLSERNQVNID